MKTSYELIKFYIQSGVLARFSAAEGLVLLTLANNYSHLSGCSFPSQEYVAEKTGLSRQTVNEAVKKLKNEKMIFVEKKKADSTNKISNVYYFMHADLSNYDNQKHKDFTKKLKGVKKR